MNTIFNTWFAAHQHDNASVLMHLPAEDHAALVGSGLPSVAAAFGRLAQEIVSDGFVLVQLAAGDYAKIKAELTALLVLPAETPPADDHVTI